jgi:hypothetical protein
MTTITNPTPPYAADIMEGNAGRVGQAWQRFYSQQYAYLNSLGGGTPTTGVVTTAVTLPIGDIIIGAGNDTVAPLPGGALGQSLMWGGSGPVWGTPTVAATVNPRILAMYQAMRAF